MAAEATVGGEMSMSTPTGKTWKVGGIVILAVAVLALAWQQAIWPLNQGSEKALQRRAQQFWDLKTSGDTLGAYDYMVEAYRKRVTPAGFAREGQGLVIHTGATVKGIQLDKTGDVAQVTIELRHIFNKKPFADMEATSPITERWILEDGAWRRWPFGFRG